MLEARRKVNDVRVLDRQLDLGGLRREGDAPRSRRVSRMSTAVVAQRAPQAELAA